MARDTRPPAWWVWASAITALFVLLVCGVILWSFVPPVVFFPIFVLASWALLMLGVVWLVVALTGWFKYGSTRWTAVAPILVVLTFGLVALSVPSQFAFAVSERPLTAAARECRQTFDSSVIGIYRVRYVQDIDAGCLFFLEGGLFDSIGLAYLPGTTPDFSEPGREGEIGYQEFDGDWYQFVQKF